MIDLFDNPMGLMGFEFVEFASPHSVGRRLLLQIFSQTLLGPVFFEFIQRKGDDGFGEGNFEAFKEFDR